MLYSHQKKIIKEDKKRFGLFLGTGSAKTLTALHLAQGKILCVTPKIQNEEKNFLREAEKWGIKKDITQISKEQFKKHVDTLPRYDTIIFDEAHTIAGVLPNTKWVKGYQKPMASQLYEAVVKYIEKNKPSRIYPLTATPIRSPMCVWGLATILGANWNYYQFRDTFYVKIKKGFREFYIPRNDKATKERLGKAVRAIGYTGQLSDYFDVPEQLFKEEYVEVTKAQKDRLKSIVTEFPDPLVLIGKKHQIENGTLAGDTFSKSEIIDDNKIDKLKDFALEFPKMIIYAKYTLQIEKIVKELSKEGYNVLSLTGKTKARDEVIKKAEGDKECILVIQSQISAGYELPSFPVMIFASQSYSVVDRVQAEGRILRANFLKKNLYITLITRGGIDEAVNKSIINKVDFSEHIYAEKGSNLPNKI